MFTWRTVDKLGCPAIAARLNADPAPYPPPNPGTGWTAQNVRVMLANPKYTGHLVYGRHRTRNGRRTPVPADQWLWSPAPVRPAIVDRATWEAAQDVGAGHGTSRDGGELNSHPATRRFYPYRSRVRCCPSPTSALAAPRTCSMLHRAAQSRLNAPSSRPQHASDPMVVAICPIEGCCLSPTSSLATRYVG
jgi:hypothetical protein